MNVERIIGLLKTIAEDLDPVGSARLAAAVVLKGKIISIGFNQDKTHPFAAKYSKHPEAIFLHAEADAIYKAKRKLDEKDLKKCVLIVVRTKSDLNHNISFGLAKPCEGCAECIKDHNIKRVIYTQNCNPTSISYTTEVNLVS